MGRLEGPIRLLSDLHRGCLACSPAYAYVRPYPPPIPAGTNNAGPDDRGGEQHQQHRNRTARRLMGERDHEGATCGPEGAACGHRDSTRTVLVGDVVESGG